MASSQEALDRFERQEMNERLERIEQLLLEGQQPSDPPDSGSDRD